MLEARVEVAGEMEGKGLEWEMDRMIQGGGENSEVGGGVRGGE